MPERADMQHAAAEHATQAEPGRSQSGTDIPVLHVRRPTLPEAWEHAVLETWQHGTPVPTQYDKPGDPPSRDATVVIEIDEPLGEPRLHRSFPAGLEELEIYVQEVVWGVHDAWIRPDEGKWSYTYHQRLFAYDVIDNVKNSPTGGPFAERRRSAVDQVAAMIDELAACGHTRRAQAITWMPTVDLGHPEPPCLQRVWCRLVGQGGEPPRLVMNTHWRSRDGYKAGFMNIFALTTLQAEIARRLSERLGRRVALGRYVDVSDSFHIYGSYFGEIERSFLPLMQQRPLADRTWRTEQVADLLLMGRVQLINGKPGEPPLDDAHLQRLYRSLPESHRALVDASAREQ